MKKMSIGSSTIEIDCVSKNGKWYYKCYARLLRVQLLFTDDTGCANKDYCFDRGNKVLFNELDTYILYHSDKKLFEAFFNTETDLWLLAALQLL